MSSSKPKIVFTDKGGCFYDGGTGKIRQSWKDAVQSAGLKTFMGDDASEQPGTLGDFLLHETAVAWVPLKKQVFRKIN